MSDGRNFTAKDVIIACGRETDQFQDENIEISSYEVENFEVEGKLWKLKLNLEGWEGLPDAFLEDTIEHCYYGLRDGPDLKAYKIGLHEK